MPTERSGATVVTLTADEMEIARTAAAASLAGGIIAAAGRPVSMQEAMRIVRDARFTLFPAHGDMAYDDWKRSHEPKRRYGPENPEYDA